MSHLDALRKAIWYTAIPTLAVFAEDNAGAAEAIRRLQAIYDETALPEQGASRDALAEDLQRARATIEAMSGDAADLTDLIHEAAVMRTVLGHLLNPRGRIHDSGCGTCDTGRALLVTEHELPSFSADPEAIEAGKPYSANEVTRETAFTPVRPHRYSPDAMAMGDCRHCGNVQDIPAHNVALPEGE